jgi:hypothetical protein
LTNFGWTRPVLPAERVKVVSNSVADPDHFVMDPDPAFQFDTGPDSIV